MRLADYVINQITDAGCDHIFLVTGRGALFLNDAVARSDKIKAIPMHHEQAAGYAAVAYAQNREKLGACLVSTGCGSTNAITAVLSAWQDGIPCVFISGQNVLLETTYHTKADLRTYGQQEANIVEIVRSITKYCTMIERSEDIVSELEKAIGHATSGRKGPVWIDIPLDLQSSTIENKLENPRVEMVAEITPCSEEDVALVSAIVSQSRRPVIVIGHGVRSSDSVSKLERFQSQTQIPIVYTASCPDVYAFSDEACVGSVGTLGCSRSGNFALQNADLILIFGNRMNSIITGDDCSKFGRDAKFIMVDIDRSEESKKTININHFVNADLSTFLDQINRFEFNLDLNNWVLQCQKWKGSLPSLPIDKENDSPVDLHTLCDELSLRLPEDSNLVTDSGSIELIFPNNFDYRNKRRAIHPSSQGAMGFALPAAVGSFFANNKPTYVIVGDGSIMMNLQELQTISHFNLPITIFIINNNMYGIIRKRQKELFRKRKIGVDPSTGVSAPSFRKLADTFGFDYKIIRNNGELFGDVSDYGAPSGPRIVEVMGCETQQYICTSHAKTESGRYVMRPIEDQSPFLDRDMFLSNMLIHPIDQ
jgi:acetolactate synthase I/II/III large subunit